jgi:hypothetical protein
MNDSILFGTKKSNFVFSSRGAEATIANAEIKPVEPDQGNSCAGKARAHILTFPVFVNPFDGNNHQTQNKNSYEEIIFSSYSYFFKCIDTCTKNHPCKSD